ncbi:MAG: phosphatase PAP2 family protein [Clostridia bacterium]|nr:phosphatase PAP2 family protein [Clostridia bacterium]
MEFLYFLESLRNPVLDSIMLLVTELGSEAVFLAVALCLFWCIDKKAGYYMLITGFVGISINQFLKLSFRIERPWVKDPNFTIVEEARAEATGYSFPSGHTQNITGVFGSIARFFSKKKLVLWISLVIIALVALSRMYLGVHTPLDVCVSLAVGALLVFVLYPLVMKAFDNEKIMYIIMGCVIAVAIAFVCYTEFYPFSADIDEANYLSGLKNSYSLLGAVLAFPVIYIVDKKYVRFETDACLWGQAVKLVVGAALALAIKSLLKAPLNDLLNGHYASNAIRYFAVVVFAGIIWPLTFRFFPKRKVKMSEEENKQENI